MQNIKAHEYRNGYLDGLRGYAALSVLIFHSILMLSPSYIVNNVLYVPIYQIKSDYFKITKFILFIFNGHTAVSIFFVLSGMVLFQSLLRNNKASVITFSIKRVIRIYLPLIPCLFVFYALSNILNYYFSTLYPHFTFHSLIENCLLYKISIHGASWTLQSEIIVIPFILLTFYMYIKIGIKSLFFLTALSILALDNDLKMNFASAGAWLYYFYLGFLCAAFQNNAGNTAKKLGWLLPFCGVVFLRGVVNYTSITSNLLQGFSIAALIIYLSGNPSDKFSSFLKLPFSQYLGKISFSLYLWNVIILNLFRPLEKVPFIVKHPLEFGLLIAALTFIITCPIAHCSERILEQPAIKLGKKLSEHILLVLLQIRVFLFRTTNQKLAE